MDSGEPSRIRACPEMCASGVARGARPGILPPVDGERGRTPPPSFAACLRPFFPGVATRGAPRPRLREYRARRRVRRNRESSSAVAGRQRLDAHGWRGYRTLPARPDLAGGRSPRRHPKCDELCGRHARGRRLHPRSGRRTSDGRRRAAARGCRGRGRSGRLGWDGRGRVRLGRLLVCGRGMDRSRGRADGPGGNCGSRSGRQRRRERPEHRVVGGLLAAGVEVRWLSGGPEVVKRYRYLHAKYAIVDRRVAWIGSENFGNAGFPPDREGNRGWSVIVDDPDLSDLLRNVFEADFDPRRPDSVPAHEAVIKPLPSPPPLVPWSAPPTSAPRAARIVLAPDTSLDPEGILGFFASAKRRLSIDAFYLDEVWRDTPNPFLEAAFAAARRGGSLRILLDGGWGSGEGDSGTNDDVRARVNPLCRKESL